ncbi:MAG: cytidine deaminase [Clostridia bacterium]|nr:cytidine deaminase [Clostridia bacterium]
MMMRQLLDAAIAARENAYAPYSAYRVGAALLTEKGKIYTGCNMENASYSATLCAERSAFSAAVSAGERRFVAIAVAGGKGEAADEMAPPCGVCHQVMAEFCDPDTFEIILGDETKVKTFTLKELFPLSFGAEELK